MGSATDPTVVETALDPVLARGVADGDVDEKLRDVLTARAEARGDWDRAKGYGQNRGYLRRFAVAGPRGPSALSPVTIPAASVRKRKRSPVRLMNSSGAVAIIGMVPSRPGGRNARRSPERTKAISTGIPSTT